MAKRSRGEVPFFHGTAVESALDLLNGAPLDLAASARLKIDGPPGFFLATDPTDALFFAARRGRGTLLEVRMTRAALRRLRRAGAIRRPIPVGARSPRFRGEELYLPGEVFHDFNRLRSAGQIRFFPGDF